MNAHHVDPARQESLAVICLKNTSDGVNKEENRTTNVFDGDADNEMATQLLS